MRWPGFPAVRGLFAGRVIRRAGLNAARPPARREQLGDGGPAAAAGVRARAAQDPVQRGHACVPHRTGQRGEAGPRVLPVQPPQRHHDRLAGRGHRVGVGPLPGACPGPRPCPGGPPQRDRGDQVRDGGRGPGIVHDLGIGAIQRLEQPGQHRSGPGPAEHGVGVVQVQADPEVEPPHAPDPGRDVRGGERAGQVALDDGLREARHPGLAVRGRGRDEAPDRQSRGHRSAHPDRAHGPGQVLTEP